MLEMVRQLAKIVRFWFGLQAVLAAVFALAQPLVVFRAITSGVVDPEESHNVWTGSVVMLAVSIVMAGVFARAWWTLRKGRPSARAWAIAASILSLPVIGFGTVAGLIGLTVFSRKDIAPAVSIPERPRIQGDGTSKMGDKIASVANILLLIISLHWWHAWADRHGLPQADGFRWFVEFEIALLASVLCHELGHVFGGWAGHMKLRSFAVGPFESKISNGKRIFRFNLAGIIGGGHTGMVAANLKHIRSRTVFMIAGGPVASLVSGLVAAMAALLAKGQPWEPWWECCAIIATLGITGFIGNLLPIRPEDQYSDGAHLYQLLSRGPWADVHMATSMVGSSLVTPLRPRDFDAAALERAAAFLTTGRLGFLMRLYQCMHFLDSGRVPRALQAFAAAESIASEIRDSMPANLNLEMVFVCAFYRRDLTGAKIWWQRYESRRVARVDVDYWKSLAALAWLEGDLEKARDAWRKGSALAEKLPAAGAYDYDRFCFTQLRRVLDAPPAGIPEICEPVPALSAV